jgi:hypothetical protein
LELFYVVVYKTDKRDIAGTNSHISSRTSCSSSHTTTSSNTFWNGDGTAVFFPGGRQESACALDPRSHPDPSAAAAATAAKVLGRSRTRKYRKNPYKALEEALVMGAGLLLICVVGAVVGGVVGGTRQKHGSAQVENPPGYVCSYFFRHVGYSEVLLSLLSSVEASHPCCLEGKSDLLMYWFRRIKIDVKGERSIGAKVC